MNKELNFLKEKLAKACRILDHEGITDRGKGHQCYLLPDGEKILIPGHLHEIGLGIGDVKVDDIVTIDFKGKVLEGKHSEPMGEFYMYTAVFKKRKDVKSCVHIHPPYANILSVADCPITAVSRDGCLFKEGVPIFEKFPLYIGTEAMGEEFADALGPRRAILHRGHGALVVGGSIEEALIAAITLEKAAMTQLFASIIGKPRPFPSEMLEQFDLTTSAIHFEEAFGYFARKLEKAEGRRAH